MNRSAPAQTVTIPVSLIAVTLIFGAALAIHRYGAHRYAQGYITATKYRCCPDREG